MTRRGVTTVELLVAALVLATVVAGAWLVARVSGRRGAQLLRYTSLLHTASSIRSRLARDLYAARLPADLRDLPHHVRVSPDGLSLGILRTARTPDPAAPPAGAPSIEFVQWDVAPDPEGRLRLEQNFGGGQVFRWPDAVVRDVHFALRRVGRRVFLRAQLSLGAPGGDPDRRWIPLRVVRELRPARGVPRGARRDFPDAILGPLPPDRPHPDTRRVGGTP